MKKLVFILLLFCSAITFGQDTKYFPSVVWRTRVDSVIMVTDTTYRVKVDPIDFSDPGATNRVIGNYLKDYSGVSYEIIDSTLTSIIVRDRLKVNRGPQQGQIGLVYQSVQDSSPYLAPIYYRYLDETAFDYSRQIELAVLWEQASLYRLDSANIVWFQDTLSTIATKYDLVSDSIFDNFNGAFRLWGGIITNNLNGTVSIAEGAGVIKNTEAGPEDVPLGINQGQGGKLHYVHWDSVASLSLTDNAYNYIYIDGTDSIIKATTNFYSISFTQDFTLGRAYRQGTEVIVRLCGTNGWNFNRRVQLFGEEVFPVVRAKGLMISEVPTRGFALTAGILWAELVNRFSISSYSTATTPFRYYYNNGSGGWTTTSSNTQINNLHWDNGTGTLATLTANRYGVHWVYVVHDGSVHVIFGQGDYTLVQAENATPPATLPGMIEAYATLVGKIIIQRSGTTFTEILSPFTTFFGQTAVAQHNELGGLQGGEAGYYGHLTTLEHNKLKDSVLVKSDTLAILATKYDLDTLDTGGNWVSVGTDSVYMSSGYVGIGAQHNKDNRLYITDNSSSRIPLRVNNSSGTAVSSTGYSENFATTLTNNTHSSGVGLYAQGGSRAIRGVSLSSGSITIIGEVNSTTGTGVAGINGDYTFVGSLKTGVLGAGTDYDFLASGAGVDYGTSSSIRWKSNVTPIPNALAKIDSIRGVYFTWDEKHGGGQAVGFIAEEVGMVMPEIVVYEKNGIDANGMDYSKITPLLLQAIKELKAEIEALKDEINNLK